MISSMDVEDKNLDSFCSLWDQLTQAEDKYKPEDFPLVSIIIPTVNCSQMIALTLEGILKQDYFSYEVIIVDCSEDRTLEVVKSFRSDKIRIYSVAQSRRYEMLNKGLSQAKGFYVNFLFPGDFYIHRETLKYMMALALQNSMAHLVYCGTLLRDGKGEVKILFREFNLDLLKNGQQPTSIQSCWFRADCLKELGKFDPNYSLRGGFELLCRFYLRKQYKFASLKRVLTDYDLRLVTRSMIITHFLETMKTVYRYFGWLATLRWLIIQKEWLRFIKLWLRSLKIAFSGR